jgi:hypothetical protein
MLKQTIIVPAIAALPFALYGAGAVAQHLTAVPTANSKAVGMVAPTILSPQLVQVVRAAGAYKVENPTADVITHYGYANANAKPMIPAFNSSVEAQKTEPDKNTYLVLDSQSGPDANYDYGRHFLFQGHELGASGKGAITRINLDADGAHRVTVLATTEQDGATPLATIDGSTWYPFSGRLLFSQEGDGTTSGGIWQATPGYPSTVDNLTGIMGRGGYEGIQADSAGNIWIVEDIGGLTIETKAKVPNSFVYRFVPKNRDDLLAGGKLQALQVASKANPGQPIAFQTASALTQDLRDLHTYGNVFDTKWVTIHDTAVDGTTPFNANQLAKNAKATPFKRPENGQFRPGSGFREFFFDETGDTDATSAANPTHGGWGSVMKLTQASPSADTGKLTMFFKGDQARSGFDNVAFWDENRIVFVEDAGDTLHTQRNALDSAWMFDVRKDYSNAANQPVRIMAQGRDPSATIDSALVGSGNEGDNEITGFHVSDGDAGVSGLLGAKRPRPFKDGWRVFYTQQHGDNATYEILPNAVRDSEDHGDGHDD